MAFLFSTSFLCLYGVLLGIAGIKRDMNANNVWNYAYTSHRNNKLIILQGTRELMYFIVGRYQMQVATIIFAGAAGLIVLFFSVFQMHRLCTGYTTNEVFRMREMKRNLREQQHYQDHHHHHSGSGEFPVTWDTRWRQSLSEVMWPGYYLQRAPSENDKRA